tara:strand:+ start:1014 stop:2123 length:1110 start_codon:yes stop_codon:yes gene_type:complete
MSYFELKDNDVFVNTIEANPDQSFYIHDGNIYLNNHQAVSGTYSDNILGVPEGYVSLFEYNVNRASSNRIYPFITKGAHKQTFKSISKTDWNTQFNYDGEVITGSYNLSSSISRETMSSPSAKLRALRSALKHNEFWSQSFDYITYYQSNVAMINIPSIFYGSSIKKGSVSLKVYVEGALVAEALDTNRRGELIYSGSIIGNILYDEGIILINENSTVIGSYGGLSDSLYWTDFLHGIASTDVARPDFDEVSFGLHFQGISQVQNMTILAKAPEGMLNHSNNPTYLQKSENPFVHYHTSSYEFIEKRRKVKNVVPSEQTDFEPPFDKETYISKICLYDEHRKLVGVCKLATPIRKTEAKEYLFKMKIDL